MKRFSLCLAAALLPAAAWAQSTPPPAPEPGWSTTQITPYFWAEGACAADVNQDGKVDILSGPYWYAGPDFKTKHEIYPAKEQFKLKKDGKEEDAPGYAGFLSGINKYSENFISYAHDVNGDGWADYVVIGFPGKETAWYENPQRKTGAPWAKHVMLEVTDNESPMFVDVTGDGKPELVCMSGGFIGYAEADWTKPAEKWTWHAVSPKGAYQRFTHGIGYGDINGDGRVDLLEAKGWWEQPATRTGEPWKFHPALFGDGSTLR